MKLRKIHESQEQKFYYHGSSMMRIKRFMAEGFDGSSKSVAIRKQSKASWTSDLKGALHYAYQTSKNDAKRKLGFSVPGIIVARLNSSDVDEDQVRYDIEAALQNEIDDSELMQYPYYRELKQRIAGKTLLGGAVNWKEFNRIFDKGHFDGYTPIDDKVVKSNDFEIVKVISYPAPMDKFPKKAIAAANQEYGIDSQLSGDRFYIYKSGSPIMKTIDFEN